MPLHEYLEQKRRQNITQLDATGACHICGSTCRNSQGFRHFLDNETNEAASAVEEGNYSENSMVPLPDLAAMRTCACFGQSSSDPDYWPYSLRVCDKCIEDDAGIGRIRSCGICGTVACDENCGAELLECTDCAEWNNAGCLECRKMGDFSEMDPFRRKDGENGGTGEHTPITRICVKCLDMSTPWVKYDFVCRRFRCETRLVPSDIAERKRFCTFGTSPLNLLPGDSLVAVVDFLSGSDLKQLFLTCSAMCTVAERVAKEKVERVHHGYPTGPIVITKRKDGFGQIKNWTHFEGKNAFGLRAPDDEKAWVGVYHYLEKITNEMFYFGFQMTGPGADGDAVERFINRRGDKFTFGQAYSKIENNDLLACPTVGFSVRGGCVLVTGEGDVMNVSPLTIASSKLLVSGTHRIICRLFCPGSGGARGNRDANNYRLGSIGILRTNQTSTAGEGLTNAWAQRADIMEGWLKEDVVVGLEYNADERSLVIHSNAHLSRASRFVSNRHAITETPGDLFIALELTSKSANVAQTLLSVREVDDVEWTKFLEHTTEGNPLAAVGVAGNANGADIFQPIEAMEAMEMAVDGNAENNPIMRFAIRNRRRERPPVNVDDDDDGDDGHRILVRRAMEEGRAVARVLLPRRDRGQDDAPAVNAAAPPPGQQRGQPMNAMQGLGRRTRRVVRALRPFARAAAMPEEAHVENDVDAAERWQSDAESDDFSVDGNLVDMDEEVAAGEFVRQMEIQQAWPEAEPENALNREGNAGNNA